MADEVRALACGLHALGFRRGEHLAIIGDNRPQLYWAMAAAQALGGVPVPLYQDALADEMVYILDDADDAHRGGGRPGAGGQAARDQAPRCRTLEHIIYEDPRGMRNYEQASLHRYERAAGARPRRAPRDIPPCSTREVAQGHGRRRRGHAVHLGHDRQAQGGVPDARGADRRGARRHASSTSWGRDDEVLSYLPMAWVGDNLFSYAQALVAGFTINCPESGDTVMTDMREIGPTYYFAPPRIFENLLTQVTIRMEDASADQALAVPLLPRRGAALRRRDPRRQAACRSRIGFSTRWATLLVYGPLRNVLGMSRIRVAYTAGAAIGPDLFRFYRSIGINLKQLYGSTETCAYVCLQPDGADQARHGRACPRPASK